VITQIRDISSQSRKLRNGPRTDHRSAVISSGQTRVNQESPKRGSFLPSGSLPLYVVVISRVYIIPLLLMLSIRSRVLTQVTPRLSQKLLIRTRCFSQISSSHSNSSLTSFRQSPIERPQAVSKRPRPSQPSSTPQQLRHCSCRKMCGTHADAAGSMASPTREVLPTNVKPTHYDLTLEPDFDKFTFNGTVAIEQVALALCHLRR